MSPADLPSGPLPQIQPPVEAGREARACRAEALLAVWERAEPLLAAQRQRRQLGSTGLKAQGRQIPRLILQAGPVKPPSWVDPEALNGSEVQILSGRDCRRLRGPLEAPESEGHVLADPASPLEPLLSATQRLAARIGCIGSPWPGPRL